MCVFSRDGGVNDWFVNAFLARVIDVGLGADIGDVIVEIILPEIEIIVSSVAFESPNKGGT